MAGYRRRIVTYITEERHKQFDLQLIRDESKHSAFVRKLLRLGIEKYNADRKAVIGAVRGHMEF